MPSPFVPPRFGTDGLRGRAGEPPLDPLTLRRVGAALGVFVQGAGPGHKRVLLGNDGRASAPWIQDALVQGLAAAEVSTIDLGLSTTPALAYLTRVEPVVAGIMISASHNPAEDNGVKIFGHDGAKLPDAAEREIERLTGLVDFAMTNEPRSKPRRELLHRYEESLANRFSDLDLRGVRLVVDAAHGGASELAPAFLRRLGAEVIAVGCSPDGSNINAGVGALYPEQLGPRVVAERALLGICLDGDGDRGIFIDDHGWVRDGDEVLAVMARHLHGRGLLPHATAVATVMSNLGLRRCLERAGIALHTTPVGDRHVVQAMRTHGFALGGEQSGHIVFATADYTGDGLYTALELLALPGALQGTAPLFAGFQRFPQLLLNVKVARKPELHLLPEVQAAVQHVEQALGQNGRVVLRYSGTEDLCRVMVEGPEEGVVRAHAEQIAAAVQKALA